MSRAMTVTITISDDEPAVAVLTKRTPGRSQSVRVDEAERMTDFVEEAPYFPDEAPDFPCLNAAGSGDAGQSAAVHSNRTHNGPAVAKPTIWRATMYRVERSSTWHLYKDCAHIRGRSVVTGEPEEWCDRQVNDAKTCKSCAGRKAKALRALQDLI
jgi:hypothetical protein